MPTTPEEILKKYSQIIKEEVNVKDVQLLPTDQKVTIQYVPLGNKLGEQFGKDTGRIIGSAKKGNAELEASGNLLVSDQNDSWSLSPEQFEVRYSGFDQDNQIIEEGAMIELDLELTDELIKEGVAREMSRFLNQMRKDADYDISDRIALLYTTDSEYLAGILEQNTDYLKTEALLSSIKKTEKAENSGDHTAEFIQEDYKATFIVKR